MLRHGSGFSEYNQIFTPLACQCQAYGCRDGCHPGRSPNVQQTELRVPECVPWKHRQFPSLWKLGPPASPSSAFASIIPRSCANMVSVPTQGASRAVIQAVCNGRVVRCAAPSMSHALQRELSRLVHQQPAFSAKPSQSILRSKRGSSPLLLKATGLVLPALA